MSSIIEVENLSFSYTNEREILKDVTFSVNEGTFLAIAGPNGAGKSTLLNLIRGLLKPDSGKIRIDESPIGSFNAETLAEKLAIVRQENVPAFGFSVIETVMMARIRYLGASGFESHQDIQAANEALEATDTVQFASRPLSSLSGGERQRVFIARAFAQGTSILLLDEPTSFLDLKHQVGIYDLLKTVQIEKHKTIVAVTHDINLASQYCDEILLLSSDGSYYAGNTRDVLSSDRIRQVFDVEISEGKIGSENFYIPLGKFSSGRLNDEI